MTNERMKQLLECYQDGTLTDDEMALLNSLSRRDEVFASADRRVRHIKRVRFARGAGLVAVLGVVLGVGIGMINSTGVEESPTVVAVTQVAQPTLPTEVVETELVQSTVEQQSQIVKVAPKKAVPTVVESSVEDEPVVVCNNSCDADSIIDEIWKFLAA